MKRPLIALAAVAALTAGTVALVDQPSSATGTHYVRHHHHGHRLPTAYKTITGWG